MIRLVPRGLTWRIVVVVLLAIVMVQAAGLVLFLIDRRDRAAELVRASARQVVATTHLYETAAPDRRRLVLDAVAGPLLRIRPSAELSFLERQGWEPAPFWVASGVRARLGPLSDRSLRVFVRDGFAARRGSEGHWHRRGDREHLGRPPDFEPSRRRLAVSVPLLGGGWLTFLVADAATSVRWAFQTALFWAMTLIVVLIVALWAGRRVAGPFRRFAAAADRLGTDLAAPALEETGSGELRQAIRAFNRMQARLRRMLDDRTMMLGAISHDLRTMLTRLRLRTELIEDDDQRARAERDVEEMQAMIEATLAYVRGAVVDEPREVVDLAALLQTVVDDRDGDRIVYDGPNRCRLHARPKALRRLFDNLVENAVRYGERGVVRLSVRTAEIVVDIEDEGPGLSPAQLERVFEPFYRVEGSRSRATGGVGLGLAIARSIAREHGGDIALQNRDAGGLQVRVRLPAGASDPT